MKDIVPLRQVKFSCYDSSLRYQRHPVNNATVPSFLLLGRVPHNAAHVICFCLPPTIVIYNNDIGFEKKNCKSSTEIHNEKHYFELVHLAW